MPGDLEVSIVDDKRDSNYSALMIDEAATPKTYQNRCKLTFIIMILCISIYYYGHILTNLATFS